MKRLRGFALLVIVSLLWPAAADPQDAAPEKPEAGPKKLTSLQKSLLIPGWGQAAEGHYLEGLVFFGAELFACYEVLRTNHRGNESYARYQAATTTEDVLKYRELTIKNDQKRNQLIVAAAGVWALNLVHIYLLVKHKEARRAKWDVRLDVKTTAEISLCIHYTY